MSLTEIKNICIFANKVRQLHVFSFSEVLPHILYRQVGFTVWWSSIFFSCRQIIFQSITAGESSNLRGINSLTRRSLNLTCGALTKNNNIEALIWKRKKRTRYVWICPFLVNVAWMVWDIIKLYYWQGTQLPEKSPGEFQLFRYSPCIPINPKLSYKWFEIIYLADQYSIYS
jgi:hypothetical protein